MEHTPSPASDVPIKRPPEDEESFDLSLTPNQQAMDVTSDSAYSSVNGHALDPSEVSTFMESQLRDKSADELIALILQAQSNHKQQVADLATKYANVSRQLSSLKSELMNYFTSQTATTQAVMNNISSLEASVAASLGQANVTSPPPASSRSHSISSPAPTANREPSSIQTPRQAPTQAVPPEVPRSTETTRDLAAHNPNSMSSLISTPAVGSSQSPAPIATLRTSRGELKITPNSDPNEPPNVEPSALNTVTDVWQEYKYGRGENQSVESLDAVWGPRWRPNATLRTWYSRRKVVHDKIKELMADGIDETTAVKEVEHMRRGRSMNWLVRLLQEDRKETKASWKAAQKAATAAKEARASSIGIPGGSQPIDMAYPHPSYQAPQPRNW